jgi:hypothetical protein
MRVVLTARILEQPTPTITLLHPLPVFRVAQNRAAIVLGLDHQQPLGREGDMVDLGQTAARIGQDHVMEDGGEQPFQSGSDQTLTIPTVTLDRPRTPPERQTQSRQCDWNQPQ